MGVLKKTGLRVSLLSSKKNIRKLKWASKRGKNLPGGGGRAQRTSHKGTVVGGGVHFQ